MKNVFGVDASNENVKIDGSIFVERRIDYSISKSIDENRNKMHEYENKAFPKINRTLKNIAFYAFLVLLWFTVLAIGKNKNLIVLFVVLDVFFLALSIVFSVLAKKIEKRVVSSEDFINTVEEGEKIYGNALQELKIPDNAKNVDVFLFIYKEKHEKLVSASPIFDYYNFESKLFIENGKLMVADCETVLSFDLSTITEIKKIDKKIRVYGWNKSDSVKDKKYIDSGVKIQNNILVMSHYYEIRITYFEKEYFIAFPPYEFETVSGLLNLSSD